MVQSPRGVLAAAAAAAAPACCLLGDHSLCVALAWLPPRLQTLPTTSAREQGRLQEAGRRRSGGHPKITLWFPCAAAASASRAAPPPLSHVPCARSYAYLYHQKDMLEDHKRTGAYYNACMQNRAQFAGKTVLDVGTGSGILAILAAKAGAG